MDKIFVKRLEFAQHVIQRLEEDYHLKVCSVRPEYVHLSDESFRQTFNKCDCHPTTFDVNDSSLCRWETVNNGVKYICIESKGATDTWWAEEGYKEFSVDE